MECPTPSRWSTCSRTVSARAARSSWDVTSRPTTGGGLGSRRATSSVSRSWRPKEVNTTSAPSCWARRATWKAMDASVSTPVTRIFLPSSRAMVSPFGGRRWPFSRRSADPDEHRVRPVDLPELDGRAGPRGVDLQVAAGVDGHVSGPPHEVARLCLVSRDHRADVALAGRAAGEGDAQLGEHVGREPGAVEAVRGGAPVDVPRTDVAGGDLQD